MLLNEKKSGMITVELAVSLVLVVVALFVALGLFSDNLKVMFTSGNFKNIFNKDNKVYTMYSRDYASSQISVQVMGEQGLQMLRKTANNTALSLIPGNLPEGVPTVVPSNPNLAYLASIIQVLVGDPSICVYMNRDSRRRCNSPEIGGFKYNIPYVSASNNALTITKVKSENAMNPSYSGPNGGVQSGYPDPTSSALSSTDISNMYSSLEGVSGRYASSTSNSVASLTDAIKKNKSAFDSLIASVGNGPKLWKTKAASTNQPLKAALIVFLNSVKQSVDNAKDDCSLWDVISGDCTTIGSDDKTNFNNWFTPVIADFNKVSGTPQDTMNFVTNKFYCETNIYYGNESKKFKAYEILNDNDGVYYQFTNGLKQIGMQYNVSVNLSCSSSYTPNH